LTLITENLGHHYSTIVFVLYHVKIYRTRSLSIHPAEADSRYVGHLCRRAKIALSLVQKIITVLLSYAVVCCPVVIKKACILQNYNAIWSAIYLFILYIIIFPTELVFIFYAFY